jgi:hypothetical protein
MPSMAQLSSSATPNSRAGIVWSFSLHLSCGAAGGNLCLALFPKEDAEDQSARFGLGAEAI